MTHAWFTTQPIYYTPIPLYFRTQMCFPYQTGLPFRQLLAIPKVAWATVQWKILGNFHVAKDCFSSHTLQSMFFSWGTCNEKLTQQTERSHFKQGGTTFCKANLHSSRLYLNRRICPSQETQRPFLTDGGFAKYSKGRDEGKGKKNEL